MKYQPKHAKKHRHILCMHNLIDLTSERLNNTVVLIDSYIDGWCAYISAHIYKYRKQLFKYIAPYYIVLGIRYRFFLWTINRIYNSFNNHFTLKNIKQKFFKTDIYSLYLYNK